MAGTDWDDSIAQQVKLKTSGLFSSFGFTRETGQNTINNDLLILAATLLAKLEHRQDSTPGDTLKSPD
jgi:hypothetical protein